MDFRILGPLEVVDGDDVLPLGGGRQRALLALLLTRPNEVVSTDRLVDQLWGAQPPKTALNTVQYYVSRLRKLLGSDRIVTRPPGYFIRVEAEELDLERFERLAAEDSAQALHQALELWRGPALADLAYESFAQEETARLEELRLAVQERRIDADLESGRSGELVGELEQLIAQHPLRERLRGQLMLALYRSGRQAEALAAYQAARSALVEELGIEPAPALQELERAMLRQDPSLDLAAEPPAPERSILVAARAEENLDALIALAEPLACGRPARELILVRLTGTEGMGAATALLNGRREALTERGVVARAVVFTSAEPGDDLVRLASEQDTDLVLVDCPLAEDALEDDLVAVLSGAPCDVALLVERKNGSPGPDSDHPVFVPFGGAEHDWAAVEVAAWIARACGASLRLAGAEGDPGLGKRDASRLLASASLLVQRAVGVVTDPVLVPRGAEGIVRAADDAGLVVSGVSPLWHRDGLGETRLAIARRPGGSTLFVRRGLRPGGLAPERSLTRFTWSIPADAGEAPGRPS
jgi:DNA-binding SARP family transcriptional activator